eukprot:gene4859-5104_t
MVHVHGNKDYEDPAAAYDLVSRADGLMYSLCPGPRHPAAQPDTPVILHSLESSHMYPCINDAARMRHVQIEMTYRTCSQVPVHYYGSFGEGQYPAYRGIQKESLPFEEKLDAIMAVISNCNVSSGRQEIMRGLQKAINETGSKLQIHQYGSCDRNMPKDQVDEFNKAGGLAKSIWGRKYKFCVTIEYDIETDFVSDKLYQALTAGCVPIHLGAPNIDYFVPNMSAIIWYPEFGTPRALLAELERLAYNKTAYMEKLAWKKLNEWELSPGFTRLFELSQHSPVCRLCMAVAEYREADPKPRRLLCTANSTWWGASQTATELQEKMLRDAALAENGTSALNGSALHNSSSASGLIWDPDHVDEDEVRDGEAAVKPTAAGKANEKDADGKANADGKAGADGKADAGTQAAGGKEKDASKTTDTSDTTVIDKMANKKLPVELKGDADKPSKAEEQAEGENDAGKTGAAAGKGADTAGAQGKTKDAAAKGNLDSKDDKEAQEDAEEKQTDGKDNVAAQKKDDSAASGPSFRFSVCSYNILADKYAKHYRSWLYSSVASCHLDWQHRRSVLVAELAHLQPDVVCLQEVDRYDTLEPELEQLG